MCSKNDSEYESCKDICTIVVRGVATTTVVVGRAATEARIAGVLERQIDILYRPVGEVGDVAFASRTPVCAARKCGGQAVVRYRSFLVLLCYK